jgi:alkylation response protein AidB-like acyl-CoA dehydrogenase
MNAMEKFGLPAWENFCKTEIRNRSRQADAEAKIPAEIRKGMAELGYLKIFHGGNSGQPGVSGDVLYRAMEVLAEACASTFWSATISSALCGRMIAELCGDVQRERWVPQLCTGKVLGCFAATERGSGSDPASYQTTVRRHGGGWILNGEKTRVTNAPEADVAVVLAKSASEEGESQGLALVVLDMRKHPVARSRHGSMGLRAMPWGTLHFESLVVDDDSVIGITMPKTLQSVEWGQVIQTVSAIGLAHSALRMAEDFVSARLSFGKNLSEFSAVRAQLQSAKDEIAGARIYARKAINLKAHGELGGSKIVIAKIFSTEASVRACEVALRCAGGWGYTTDLELERFLRDAYGNIPSGLPNDRLRELLICPKLGVDPWSVPPVDRIS